MNNLSFMILSGRAHLSQAQESLEATYQMWQGVWIEAIRELDGPSAKLTSDDFNRHDAIGVLCADGGPIGSVSFSRVDLTLESWRADSYFAAWPREALLELARAYPGPEVLIGCYFTLKKEWRREAAGFSAKQLLMALTLEYFRSTSCSIMVGTMRVNRGMNSLSYETGARAFRVNREQHGVAVDLVIWDREPVAKYRYQEQARELFASRTDFIPQTLRRVA